jgi:hypothetical protein
MVTYFLFVSCKLWSSFDLEFAPLDAKQLYENRHRQDKDEKWLYSNITLPTLAYSNSLRGFGAT